jgi:hypothetical protein
MNIPGANRWKEELEFLLRSIEERDTGELIHDICDFAAAIGYDACDELLATHPEFFAYQSRLTNLFRQFVVSREVAEARHLLR